MTVKKLQQALRKLGVPFKSNDRKAKLEELLAEAQQEETVEEEVQEEQEELEEEAQSVFPTSEGVRVRRILDSGHNATQFHCKMEDGTTRHVDKALF